MGKVMPLAILMVMVTLLFISWGNVSKYNTKFKMAFENHMTAAQAYEEKKIYIDAVSEYEMALAMQPKNYELAVKIKDLYKELGDVEKYLAACERVMNMDPTNPEMHHVLINYYWDKSEYNTAYGYLRNAQNYLPDDEEVKTKIKTLKGKYTTMSATFDEFKGWCYTEENNAGSAVILINGKCGILNEDNTPFLNCNYEGLSPFMGGVFPIKIDDEYYYADSGHNRRIVPDEPAEYLGPFNNGLAVTKVNGLYGYIDMTGKSYHIQFEDAGSFSNGVAPVKMDGKWYLTDSSFNAVKGLAFEDILMDEYGFCSVYGVFFGKMDGKYHLYDVEGNNLSAAHCNGFEDAKLFVSDQPAAVKIDGKWGFISKNGEIIIEPKYEDADSFNFSYAPFMKDGKWGCIGPNEEVWIDPTFDHMTAFARNGLALIERNGTKQFIRLSY